MASSAGSSEVGLVIAVGEATGAVIDLSLFVTQRWLSTRRGRGGGEREKCGGRRKGGSKTGLRGTWGA